MTKTKFHTGQIIKVIFIVLLPFEIIFMNWVVENPEWVETHYSLRLYPAIQSLISSMSGLIRLPIGQLVFYTLFSGLIIWVVKRIIMLIKGKISFGKFVWITLKNGLFAFSLFNLLFNLTWGLNYHRLKIPEITGLDVKEVTREELIEISHLLGKRSNEMRAQIEVKDELPITDKQILERAFDGFTLASGEYAFIKYKIPSVKSVLVPKIMSSFSIGGIYFMFTGEANVNMDAPNFLVPATTCHEMAHQAGFASEDEANFISYLATQLNPDPHFQYSGNLMAFRYTMRSLYRVDSLAYQGIVDELSDDVKSDLRKNREYWRSFYNPIDPLTDALYDQFLKANDQKAGIKSYSLVTSLLVGEYRRSKLNLIQH